MTIYCIKVVRKFIQKPINVRFDLFDLSFNSYLLRKLWEKVEENCEKFEIKFEIKLEQKLWKNEENFGEKLSKKFEKVEKATLY